MMVFHGFFHKYTFWWCYMGQGFWRFQDWRSSPKTPHAQRGSPPASRRWIDSVGERTRIDCFWQSFFGVKSINLYKGFVLFWLASSSFFFSFFLPKNLMVRKKRLQPKIRTSNWLKGWFEILKLKGGMASTASFLLLLLLLLLLLWLLFPTCYPPSSHPNLSRSIALFRDASRKARFKVATGGALGQQLRPMSSKESVQMHKDFFFARDASVQGKERPPGLFHKGIPINFYFLPHHKQRISFFHAGLCRRSGVPLDLEKKTGAGRPRNCCHNSPHFLASHEAEEARQMHFLFRKNFANILVEIHCTSIKQRFIDTNENLCFFCKLDFANLRGEP